MRIAPHVAALHEQLAAHGALAYCRSLSCAVQDALFSYWRLPMHVGRALATRVPAFEVAVDASPKQLQLDWARFQAALEPHHDGVSQVHVAWALALHADSIFDHEVLLWVDGALPTDGKIAHHAIVRRVLKLLEGREQGEFYMAFVVLITVLEKALYDLFHQHNASGSTSKAAKKNMILRDLLHSETLASALPGGLMALLKILFLPSGLNLRNLVWHGFMVPAEFPRCFACLTAVLLLQLPQFLPEKTDARDSSTCTQLFQLESFDDRFLVPKELRDQPIVRSLLTSASAQGCTFVPRGRERLVGSALRRLDRDGDELWFLFALLPVLEHAIRVQFVASNTSRYPHLAPSLTEFCVAQIDQYYSTLDGFGQRDKHQVLLQCAVSAAEEPNTLNALYESMPHASLAVCLDLFMMASGPNVRAKLCHGEAALSTLLVGSRPEGEFSVVTKLLLLAWNDLCQQFDAATTRGTKPDAERLRVEVGHEALDVFRTSYTSSFHPYHQLTRRMRACEARLDSFNGLVSTWSNVRVVELSSDASGDRMKRVEFLEPSGELAVVSITEKASRVEELTPFYSGAGSVHDAEEIAGKKPTSFIDFLALLRDRASQVHHELQNHDFHHHARLPESDIDQRAAHERHLLALSDADGLSVSSCMMEVLNSVERSLDSFETRLSTLASAIQDGSARTNHRRSFLNNTAFLLVFSEIQSLTLQLVKHQLGHLETVARQRATSSSEIAVCPRAGRFEQLQRKLLQFVTAFEGCTGSAESAQKSSEKALQLALQFLDSKFMKAALGSTK